MDEKEKNKDSEVKHTEKNEGKDSEKIEFLFIQFISGLYTSTMQTLGKIMNPVTGQIDKNLDAAQSTIELVRMLKEKTKGNLSKRESDTINNALANMQMNYADELKRQDESPEKEPEDKKSESRKDS